MLQLRKLTWLTIVAALMLLVLGPAAAHAQWNLQEGGLKDFSTGLVWSDTMVDREHTWSTWDYALSRAASYSVVDGGVTYDDWRLPTIAELQTAIDNGTMIIITNNTNSMWSSQRKGQKAWWVNRDGTTTLTSRLSWSDVVFVRNGN